MNESRLVVALLNSVWQTAAIAAFTIVALRLIGRTNASARCAVWMLAFIASAALPAVDYAFARSVQVTSVPASIASKNMLQVRTVSAKRDTTPARGQTAPAIRHAGPAKRRTGLTTGAMIVVPKGDLRSTAQYVVTSPNGATPETAPLGLTALSSPGPARPVLRMLLAQAVDRASSVLFWAWLCIAGVLLLRLLLQLTSLTKTKLSVIAATLPDVERQAQPQARRYTVALSERIAVPCLLGLLKPVIAIPRALASELSSGDLKRIILHESAHVRRYDDWLNLFEQLALTVLFFNPALHYISRCTNLEREIACDDEVIASEDRLFYAECLSALARRSTLQNALLMPGFFGGKRQLLVRVEQLLDRSHDSSLLSGRMPYMVMGLLSGLAFVLCQFGIPVLAANKSTAPHDIRSVASARPEILKIVVHAKSQGSVQTRAIFTRPRIHENSGAATESEAAAIAKAPPATIAKVRATHTIKDLVATIVKLRAATIAKRQVAAFRVRSGRLPLGPLAGQGVRPVHSTYVGVLGPRIVTLPQPVAKANHLVGLRQQSRAVRQQSRKVSLYDSIRSIESRASVAMVASSTMDVARATRAAVSAPAMQSVVNTSVRSDSNARTPIDCPKTDSADATDQASIEQYVKTLKAAGYTVVTVPDVSALRAHDVSAAYAAAIRAAGIPASLRSLTTLRDHDVSVAYATAMKNMIRTEADVNALTRLRDHDVSVSLAQAMSELNHQRLDVEALTRLTDHDVSPQFLRYMIRYRYSFGGELPDIAVREITQLRDHDVDTNYIDSLAAQGYSALSASEIIRLHDHCVDANFIQRMRRAHNNALLSVDELIRMHDQGK